MRILGWVLVVLGLFTRRLMGMIANYLYPTSPPRLRHGASSAAGTVPARQARMVLNLFWIIIAFGGLCVVGGSGRL